MILRAVAIVVGAALLAASAHVAIDASGGYGTPTALLLVMLALGVAVAAVAIGVTWGQGRRVLALFLGVALVAGEAFGLIQTGERLIAARADKDAVAAKAADARKAAETALAAARTAEAAAMTTPRLERAIAARNAASVAVTEKAAERGCAANCRALLEAQMAQASRDLDAATIAAEQDRREAKQRVLVAATVLANLPPLPAASPLAVRLGIAPWALDLIAAALGSIAANGLACALLAFGAHSHSRQLPATNFAIAGTMPGSVRAWAADSIGPARGQWLSSADAHASYCAWCEAQGRMPLDQNAFTDALGGLATRLGLPVSFAASGEATLTGAALRSPERSRLSSSREAA